MIAIFKEGKSWVTQRKFRGKVIREYRSETEHLANEKGIELGNEEIAEKLRGHEKKWDELREVK